MDGGLALFPSRAELAAEIAALPPTRTHLTVAEAFGQPWPVWRDSVRGPVKWRPIQKADARRWFDQAEAWSSRQALPGRGRAALAVLRAMLFRFLNWRTGRLDPSYEGLALAAGFCRAHIAEALRQLRLLGIIGWHRRCQPSTGADGRFELHQETNAYHINPPSHWRGYEVPAAEAPPVPAPDTWGAAPPLPDLFDAIRAGADVALADKLAMAEQDAAAGDPFAATLARHYRDRQGDG